MQFEFGVEDFCATRYEFYVMKWWFVCPCGLYAYAIDLHAASVYI